MSQIVLVSQLVIGLKACLGMARKRIPRKTRKNPEINECN